MSRFVGIGTCLEYDLSKSGVSIQTPLNPLSTYAGSKVSLFTSCSTYLRAQSVEFAWCRLFYLYGEGEDERRLAPYVRAKLSKGMKAEITGGNQIRDYMDVSQAGNKIVEIALSRKVGPFNICSGLATTIRAFAEKIADEYGRRDLLSFGKKNISLEGPPYIFVNPRGIPKRQNL